MQSTRLKHLLERVTRLFRLRVWVVRWEDENSQVEQISVYHSYKSALRGFYKDALLWQDAGFVVDYHDDEDDHRPVAFAYSDRYENMTKEERDGNVEPECFICITEHYVQ